MENYVLFKGTGSEYTLLHNLIRQKIRKPKKCSICKNLMRRPELANKSGKYKLDLKDWFYLCGSCHKRYDRKSWKFKESNWYKKCLLCKKFLLLSRYYTRKGFFIKKGKSYKRNEGTSWCKNCTSIKLRGKPLKINK